MMNFICHKLMIICGLIIASAGIITSCIHEDISECNLYVQFKYDYNMLSADAFSEQVDKVELFVFDEEGIFLFKQAEEGSSLTTGNYKMRVTLPVGQYKFMAWGGARNSYDIPTLTAGVSTLHDLTLKLKRDKSLIINKELEPLWYGEILDVDFTGREHLTETINLVKDTNKVRFIFQGATTNWEVDINNYNFEIIESNGFLDYINSLLNDDVLSYRPYYMEQKNPSAIVVELNTMRLMADRKTRFTVTHKITGNKVFDINLIDFLAMTEMEGHKKWSMQEYLDRQDEYAIIFVFSGGNEDDDNWLSVRININGWTWYVQEEADPEGKPTL